MAKPLGYWGCNYDYPLISDISQTFGDTLQNLPASDRVWLLARISLRYLHKSDPNAEITSDAQEIINRLEELPPNQMAALIQALAN
jgi:hypothetical protein